MTQKQFENSTSKRKDQIPSFTKTLLISLSLYLSLSLSLSSFSLIDNTSPIGFKLSKISPHQNTQGKEKKKEKKEEKKFEKKNEAQLFEILQSLRKTPSQVNRFGCREKGVENVLFYSRERKKEKEREFLENRKVEVLSVARISGKCFLRRAICSPFLSSFYYFISFY